MRQLKKKKKLGGNFKCTGCSPRDAKKQIKKKHHILTSSLIWDLVKINLLMQWDYPSDLFSKRQLSKGPKSVLLSSIWEETGEKHQVTEASRASVVSPLFPVLPSSSLYHIDLPATSFL